MTCAEIKEQTIDYLYGELDAEAKQCFTAHVRGCASCQAELGGFERVLGEARTALADARESPPASVRAATDKLTAMIATRRGWPLRTVGAPVIAEDAGGIWRLLRKPWFFPAFAAASVIALFFVAREVIIERPVLDGMPASPQPEAEASEAVRPATGAAPPAAAAPAAPQAPAGALEQPPAAEPSEGLLRALDEERPKTAGPRRRALEKPRAVMRAAAKDEAVGAPAAAPAPAFPAAASRAPTRVTYPGGGANSESAADDVESAPEGGFEPAAAGGASAGSGAVAPAAAPAPMAPMRGLSGLSARPAMDPPPTPESLRELADRLLESNQPEEAAAVYRTLIARYPKHEDVAVWKGRLEKAVRPARR